MLAVEENIEKSRKWGSITQEVVDAILRGCQTLREIADHTGFPYRSVNSTVYSLELQGRVVAECYYSLQRGEKIKRRDQKFSVVRIERKGTSSGPYEEHPSKRTKLPDFPMFGMNVSPQSISIPTVSVRVHRMM